MPFCLIYCFNQILTFFDKKADYWVLIYEDQGFHEITCHQHFLLEFGFSLTYLKEEKFCKIIENRKSNLLVMLNTIFFKDIAKSLHFLPSCIV